MGSETAPWGWCGGEQKDGEFARENDGEQVAGLSQQDATDVRWSSWCVVCPVGDRKQHDKLD